MTDPRSQPSEHADAAERVRGYELGRASELFAALPRDLGEQFRPRVRVLARDILGQIRQTVPQYARPLSGPFGTVITYAVQHAISHAVDNVGRPTVLRQQWITGFRYLGKVEFHEGRDLDCLHTAYRVGGRVAWRHVAAFGRSRDVSPETLHTVGEAIFAYVEEISALSAHGYATARHRVR